MIKKLFRDHLLWYSKCPSKGMPSECERHAFPVAAKICTSATLPSTYVDPPGRSRQDAQPQQLLL